MGADHRVLVFAPTGRDGVLAASAITEAGIPALHCRTARDLAREIQDGAGVVVVAEEALNVDVVHGLGELLGRQETWSDIPFIVLTMSGELAAQNDEHAASLEPLGNVTLLERPVRKRTLVSAVKTALRARSRQYEVRDHLEALRRGEAERERLLEAEQAARAEVEASARAKDEFLAVLSHELRTPLQAMLGWIKVVSIDRVDAATRRRGLQAIERGTRAQAQLIEDLLDISRIITGKMRIEPRAVDVGAAVTAAVDGVAVGTTEKRVTIDTIVRASDVEVSADPTRLQQIISNLVSNAVKFSRDGGRIEVSVDQAGGEAVIVVKDDGVGIPAAVLPRVFERFHQADSSLSRQHGGLGLGLAIVRHLVELHGGRVTAESPGPGFGATFTVRIPVIAASAAGATPERARQPGRGRPWDKVLRGLRLLVVDDDADTLELLVTLVEQAGAQPVPARSAAEALEILDRGGVDVIISDISMPGQDGYAFLRTVREREARYGHVPAMALTAHARPEDTRQAYLAGFEAHVAKPIDPGVLCQVIAKLADRAAA